MSCANCKSPASKVCGRCRQVVYCQLTCQQAHWSTHKPDCFDYSASLKKTADELLATQFRDIVGCLLATAPGDGYIVVANCLMTSRTDPLVICNLTRVTSNIHNLIFRWCESIQPNTFKIITSLSVELKIVSRLEAHKTLKIFQSYDPNMPIEDVYNGKLAVAFYRGNIGTFGVAKIQDLLKIRYNSGDIVTCNWPNMLDELKKVFNSA